MNPAPRQLRPMIWTVLLAAFLWLPSAASKGMFLDGILYAAISRNLADGVGSVWALHFSEGLFTVFREHPPLVFWLQSFFFRALGDSYLTERAYDAVVMLATAGLMWVLWSRLLRERGLERLAGFWWLALLMWVVVPKWSWAYRNNVLESTMALFCLASVVLVFGALRASRGASAMGLALAAAAAALLAFMSKGPAGLFVLASPLLLLPALRTIEWRRFLVVMATLAVGFAALSALVLAWPEAREMLAVYWQRQVAGRAGVSGQDLSMLFELVKKIAPMLVVLGAFRLWVGREGPGGHRPAVLGPVGAMLAVGLSASLPLMLGDLDSAHYLVPALPFLALGFGMAGASMLDGAGERIAAVLHARPGKVFWLMAGAVAVTVVAISLERAGQERKNENYHAFLAEVSDATGTGTKLAIDAALYGDWYLHAIAQRHHGISLVVDSPEAEWLLAPTRSNPPPGFRVTDIASADWMLQRREDAR